MRVKFEAQLERLNVELITMGALCEEVISGAAKALLDGDSGLRETVLAAERGHQPKGAGHRKPVYEAAAPAAAGGPGSAHHLLRPEDDL